MDSEVTVELDYGEGFQSGFLHGYMAAYVASNNCERDDCPQKE